MAIMPQSSEHIAVIIGALARVQTALMKSYYPVSSRAYSETLSDNQSSDRRAPDYDAVRRAFSQHGIAIIQTTRTDQTTGRMYLTTLLAHASGEWMSSELPVLAEVDALHEIEKALIVARRCSVLSLAGLVGNDIAMKSSALTTDPVPAAWINSGRTGCRQNALKPSALLQAPSTVESGLAFPKEPARRRSKAHLAFVRQQGCLVCQRTPADAHHLKFAQPSTLGRKVSDEFTVPLCRDHHQDLHRHGNERAWWTNVQIDALTVAAELWVESTAHSIPPNAPSDRGESTDNE